MIITLAQKFLRIVRICPSHSPMAIAGAWLAALAATAAPAAEQTTLDMIHARGEIRCGVGDDLAGFAKKSENGTWTGFDVDFCRALAAAIFDDPSKVSFTPLPSEQRFVPLATGAIDVLSRNTTWTLAREAGLGVQFAAVTYYDGQGFLTRKARGVNSALQLQGSKVCVQSGTTTELNLADYFRANKVEYTKVAFPTTAEVMAAYEQGRCDVLTSDISQLYAERAGLKAPDEHVILPDIISKEPLGPAVRDADISWLNVVKWVHYAMVNAEELGITQETLPLAMTSERAEVKRLLGGFGELGASLGLSNDWAARIIRHVGNYGESFERNVGAKSKLAIPRGLNRLWNDGGLQYAPPFR